MEIAATARVDECTRAMPALELALLRRGVEHRAAAEVRCSLCQRTPLTGERVYLADSGPVLCALCQPEETARPVQCGVVRGPRLGQAIRIIDRHVA